MKPEDFEQSQHQAIASTGVHLKDVWLTSVKNALVNGLRDVGKGWFQMNTEKREVYEISKLRRVLTLVNLMLQD